MQGAALFLLEDSALFERLMLMPAILLGRVLGTRGELQLGAISGRMRGNCVTRFCCNVYTDSSHTMSHTSGD